MIDDNGNSILPFENYVVIAFWLNDDNKEKFLNNPTWQGIGGW
jgi:hypothetical protein